MNKKNTLIIVVVVIVVAIFIFFSANISNRVKRPDSKNGQFITREAAPQNISIPSTNTPPNIPENIARPSTYYEMKNSSGTKVNATRTFSIKIEADTYKPDTIIVEDQDRLHINFTAIDKDYGFTQPDLGMNMKILKGETKIVDFRALGSSKLIFYCSVCGGPEKGPIGNIIIVPKKQ